MSDAARSLLLPPNQSTLEAALANAAAMAHRPEVIATLWDAQRCPVDLLPWLAWALSVDEWDEAWTEAQKRSQIQGSIAMHRRKGTPWAVKQALGRAGLEVVDLIEHPQGAHWAEFDIEITANERRLDDAMVRNTIALINAYKAARSHLRRIVVSTQPPAAQVYAAAVLQAGLAVTANPAPCPSLVELSSHAFAAAAITLVASASTAY